MCFNGGRVGAEGSMYRWKETGLAETLAAMILEIKS